MSEPFIGEHGRDYARLRRQHCLIYVVTSAELCGFFTYTAMIKVSALIWFWMRFEREAAPCEASPVLSVQRRISRL